MNKNNEMNSFSCVMNNMDAQIYVVDMNSYNLLFVNEKLQQIIGNALGKQCWQSIMPDQTGPCEFCTNKSLLVDENGIVRPPVIKEFKHPANQKWYLTQEQAILWHDNQYVRLRILIDFDNIKLDNEKKEKHFITREQMVGKMVHGFRTPLNAILGYTQLILYKKDYSQASREYIKAIHQCGEELLSLINGMYDFAKSKSNDKPHTQLSENRFELFDIAKKIINEPEIETETEVISKKETSKRKILVVDDTDSNRVFLINTLDIMGFSTKGASNGQHAIDIWKEWKPDLILMDIYMPDIDGNDVIKIIRKDESPGTHVIIIAVSASSIENDHSRAFSSGCDDFLIKPIKLDKLFELIEKHLNEYKTNQAIQKTHEQHTPPWLLDIIKQMPQKWLFEFKESIEMLDPIKTKFLIRKLEEKDIQAASVLMGWLKKYNFERLQQLI